MLNDLRQFQSDRWLRAEVLRVGFDEAYYGIADAHRVIKGLAGNERLGAQSLRQALSVAPAVSAAGEQPPTIRTQSVAPVVFATGEGEPHRIPRNAPCPCHSGLKYKRCCGTAAPPVLNGTRITHAAPAAV